MDSSVHSDFRSRFERVTRSKPCAICGRPDWCLRDISTGEHVCMRVFSTRWIDFSCGRGYIHTGCLPQQGGAAGSQWATPPCSLHAWRDLHNEAVRLLWSGDGADGRLLLRQLFAVRHADGDWFSLIVRAARELEVGYVPHRGLVWPMRAMDGPSWRVVGLRYRSNGGPDMGLRYWCHRGSKTGLFMPPSVPQGDVMLIVEGCTDVTAAMTLGWPCIGRPSNSGGQRLLEDAISQSGARTVIVLIDRENNDQARRVTVESANRLIERIGSRMAAEGRIIRPPKGCKDLRDWWRMRNGSVEALRRDILDRLDSAAPCGVMP